ncbi:MAG TPA: hypothetical protein VJP77_07680 [Planctomycetota bacterium]|nr:hypothetical protein [Planctomycetota bacterium]
MRTTTRLALPLLSATALAASTPPQAGLAWGPEAGASVTKTFEVDASYDLEDLSLVVAGQDVGEFIGTPEMTFSTLTKVVLADEYSAVGEGRPTKLVRTFEELENTFTMSVVVMEESSDEEGESASELEGATVVFTWDPETSEYRVAYPEETAGDVALLEDLVEDTDLRGLLPTEAVEEGATWTFEARALEALLMPSGDLRWMPEGMDAADVEELQVLMEGLLEGFEDLLDELLVGERTATFAGTREVDGVRCAVVDLAVTIDSAVDLSGLLQELVEKAVSMQEEVPEDFSFSIDTADIALAVTAEGELLWDVAAGLPHSLTMTGDVNVSFELVASATGDSENVDVDLAADLAGTMDAKVGYAR